MILARVFVASMLCAGASCYQSPAPINLDPDAQPDANNDAPQDGSGDAPADGQGDGPDAAPDAPPDGQACTATCSVDNTQLLGCNGNDPAAPVTCANGCTVSPVPHCLLPILSNSIESGTPPGVAAKSINCNGASLLFYSSGQIDLDATTLRAAGTGVVSGIGFHTIGVLSVFSFSNLTLANCELAMEYNRPLALLSLTTMRLETVHARFTGSLSSVSVNSNYCARGLTDLGSGGGGGGAATAGAKGGDTAFGGGICATPFAGPQTGSIGGAGTMALGASAGRGGPPGGAIQLSAREQIEVAGGVFSMGGGGGEGATDNGPGGGGGSGGTLLLEAPKVTYSGRVFANGGGGGGLQNGLPANGEDGPDAPGPLLPPVGFMYGGVGSSRDGSSIYPATPGSSSGNSLHKGGGGGGLGFVRINANSLSLDPVSTFIAIYSTSTLTMQ